MDDKLIVVYLIGQHAEWWNESFYQPQIKILKDSGLYDSIEFIDINISGGKEPLPSVPDKIRNISYRSKSPIEMNEIMMDLHDFCSQNSGYKVLFYHSDGVTHYGKDTAPYKAMHLEYIHFGLIEQWKICTQLLEFYDCVGLNYTPIAEFGRDSKKYPPFYAPHFRGMFWWATSDYIASLNKNFLKRDVFWNRFLGEVWIGTGKPRYYSLFNAYSDKFDFMASFYEELTVYNRESIIENATKHLNYLTDIDIHHCQYMKDLYNTNDQLSFDNSVFFNKWV